MAGILASYSRYNKLPWMTVCRLVEKCAQDILNWIFQSYVSLYLELLVQYHFS